MHTPFDKVSSTLFIIPNLISELNDDYINQVYYTKVLNQIDTFFVEKLKNARRLLKRIDKRIEIENFTWYLIDDYNVEQIAKSLFVRRMNIGLISDSGYPGIADPGNKIVLLAHKHHMTIMPLIGPSSILLALVCSGLNGQHFIFHGYLPIQENECVKKIKEIENHSVRTKYTQLFIENPYRNNQLYQKLINICMSESLLCIATDLTGTEHNIHTKRIGEWRKNKITFKKTPTIFLIGRE